MKPKFRNYLSEEAFCVKEDGWNKKDVNLRETQFTIGNGYLGLRGILEEKHLNSIPGTFIAGLYDQTSAQQTDLVNLPNPLYFKITANGEKLGMAGADLRRHQRVLDMKNGLLYRHTIFQDSRKRRFDYQSIRFASMDNPNLIAYQVAITPLDKSADLTIKHDIDYMVANQGVITEGRKRHTQIAQVYQSDTYDYLCVRTFEKGIYIGYASSISVQAGRRKKNTTSAPVLKMKAKKGETLLFTKFICMGASNKPSPGSVERDMVEGLKNQTKVGFDKLLDQHKKAMRKLWDTSDIVLKGNLDIQQAIRFNLYHLLIAAPKSEGESSIGAKTLSGEGYRGHVFWDTELFMLPFFTFTQPKLAKNMLLYRHDRLYAARKNAKKNKYKGAQFPWESADSGFECTPDWAKNFDGKIIKVLTGAMEHHINADIPYAVNQYYMVTGDDDFMRRHGYTVLFECARFWASRVMLNRKTKKFDIRHVIGPDEFHEDVNNNAFTNVMAKWVLHSAQKTYWTLERSHRPFFLSLAGEIQLTAKEVKAWSRITNHMSPRVNPVNGVMEQFDGYFKKKNVRTGTLDKYGLPLMPVGLDLSKISKTQFLKQADVVMLLHLFPFAFSKKAKKQNYDFYISRTLHKSSLSPSVHALVGNDVGDNKRAYQMFQAALFEDLHNVHGNLRDGVHAASMGGVWQAVIMGFCGVRILRDRLHLTPSLPPEWKAISFTLIWRGVPLRFSLTATQIRIHMTAKKGTPAATIYINGKIVKIKPGHHTIHKYRAKS